MAKPKNDDFKVEDHPMLAKKKTSFSIAEVSQELMSLFSEKMGLKQSQIVELAPFLLLPLITKSMERRRRSLSMVQTLKEQASRSLKTMAKIAPHLGPGIEMLDEWISRLVEAEEGAIKNDFWNGLDDDVVCSSLFFDYAGVESDGTCEIPPYQQELEEFVSDYENLRPILPLLKITKKPEELPKSPEELDEFFYGKDGPPPSKEEIEETIQDLKDRSGITFNHSDFMGSFTERWQSFESKSNKKG